MRAGRPEAFTQTSKPWLAPSNRCGGSGRMKPDNSFPMPASATSGRGWSASPAAISAPSSNSSTRMVSSGSAEAQPRTVPSGCSPSR